jgi:hypothetical protein
VTTVVPPPIPHAGVVARAPSAPTKDEVTAIAPPAAVVPPVAAPTPVRAPAPIHAAPVAPPTSALAELQRRVEELEGGATSLPPELQQRIEALKARATTPGSIPPGAVPAVVSGGLVLGPTYVKSISVAPPPPTFVVTGDIDIDTPFDGRARRRKVVVRFVIFLVLVFGGLVGAMAYSYSPQARVLLKH